MSITFVRNSNQEMIVKKGLDWRRLRRRLLAFGVGGKADDSKITKCGRTATGDLALSTWVLPAGTADLQPSPLA
jgi:hypothetical protein